MAKSEMTETEMYEAFLAWFNQEAEDAPDPRTRKEARFLYGLAMTHLVTCLGHLCDARNFLQEKGLIEEFLAVIEKSSVLIDEDQYPTGN